jgi:hypothetical protein
LNEDHVAELHDLIDEWVDSQRRIRRLEDQQNTVDPSRQTAAILRAYRWRIRTKDRIVELLETE